MKEIDSYRKDLEKVESRELIPGFHGRMTHTDSMTIAFWKVEGGSTLPEHSHHHEQVSIVSSGSFELTIDGETEVYKSGRIAVIPGNKIHSGEALTDCEIIDIFQPAREEYR